MNEITKIEYKGHDFLFHKTVDSDALIQEIFSDNYKVIQRNIDFKPGDVILDLGANEGMFSILMKKIYPQCRVVAVEPVLRTFTQLVRNIGLNGVDIDRYCLGVGKMGQKKEWLNVSKDHSGGSTSMCAYNPDHHIKTEIDIVGLDELFEIAKIEKCRLMKIDIEGMEYDALYSSTVLPNVQYVVGEFHFNNRLEFRGRRPDALATWVGNRCEFIHLVICNMAQ